MISISSCYSAAGRNLFEKIPEMLHGCDPSFVPPFPGSVSKFLRPDSLFNRQDGSILGFIARRGGRSVGRIAAIRNRTHNIYWKDNIGFFGFFACEDNEDTARALFRDTGVVALLCHDMVDRTRKEAYSAELSWIEANNTQVIKLIALMGATHSKTYAIYEKPITHGK